MNGTVNATFKNVNNTELAGLPELWADANLHNLVQKFNAFNGA